MIGFNSNITMANINTKSFQQSALSILPLNVEQGLWQTLHVVQYWAEQCDDFYKDHKVDANILLVNAEHIVVTYDNGSLLVNIPWYLFYNDDYYDKLRLFVQDYAKKHYNQ